MENLEFNDGQNLAFQQAHVQLTPNMPSLPARLVICENFQNEPLGATYGPGTISFGNNGLRYTIAYGGGARISEHGSSRGTHFLEGVEDGTILIELQPPFKTDLFELELVQAGNDPIEIRYFSDWGRNLIGTTYTSVYNQLQRITLQGQNLTTVQISGPEAFLKGVCYGLIVQP